MEPEEKRLNGGDSIGARIHITQFVEMPERMQKLYLSRKARRKRLERKLRALDHQIARMGVI